ncbi:ORF3 protein [IRE/CTVM19-associated rhabdovirus]|nr:ORF3 protein [IRE/CTVM19-associated rhabdovirus]UZH98565.1 putative protein ORF3 [IRE/CTVM19-associated rhabdovirus]
MDVSSAPTAYPFLIWMKGEVSYFGPKSAMDPEKVALEILRAFPYVPMNAGGKAFVLYKLVQEIKSSSCVLSAGPGHVRYTFTPNWKGMCVVPGLLTSGQSSLLATRNHEMTPGSNTNSVLLINIKAVISNFNPAKWSGASSEGFVFLDTPPPNYIKVCEELNLPSTPPPPAKSDPKEPPKKDKKSKDYNPFKLGPKDPSTSSQ